VSRRPYVGPSEANSQALYQREHTWSGPSAQSFRIQWDMHRREPRDLRDAVRMARKAYVDEVPDKLHDAAIGDDGTPRMTRKAEGYIFGHAQSDDAPKGKCDCKLVQDEHFAHAVDCPAHPQNRPLVGYYHAPFRACLDAMAHGDASSRRRAAIVSHVTIGSQKPGEAAIAEGAHPLDAKLVAWDALCSFLRSMTDLRLHAREEAVA
jgi:hypothetical protein